MPNLCVLFCIPCKMNGWRSSIYWYLFDYDKIVVCRYCELFFTIVLGN